MTNEFKPGPVTSRRMMMVGGAVAAGALLLEPPGRAADDASGTKTKNEGKDADIGPGEDLMREHGVLRRVLLVYREVARRLDAGVDFDRGAAETSVTLIRSFVEDYHERQEEEVLFPRFERAHRLVELVRVLRDQHQAGRRVTAQIQGLLTAKPTKDAGVMRQLRDGLMSFVRMYEPHAAREDTVLFPALHGIVSASEYDALGDEFEKRERRTFGHDGFEAAVQKVAAIEKSLGIEDLASFTPKT